MNSIKIIFAIVFTLVYVALAIDSTSRDVSYTLAKNSFTFNSVAKTSGKDGTKSKITCDIRADEVALATGVNAPLRFRLKYYSSNADTKSKLNMHASIIELVEFKLNGSVASINPNTDTVAHKTVFDRDGWTFSKESTVLDLSTTSYWFGVQDSNKVLNLTFHWSDNDYYYNGSYYGPETIKMDVDISNYSYTHGSNTYLCLHARVQSMSKIGYSKGVNAATVVSNNLALAFGWEPTVTIDGVVSSVYTSGYVDSSADTTDDEYEAGEVAKSTYYCFPAVQPSNIFWDPTLSFSSAASVFASLLTLAFGVLVSMMF